MNAADLLAFQAACHSLLINQTGLTLATIDANGEADISYAPFLYRDGAFYLYLSTLASHTSNMLQRPHVSVMLLQPEAEASNPFIRQRLSWQCQATEISSSEIDYPLRLDQMAERLGGTIAVLRQLPDFRLFRLQPRQGRFIAGFGQAFSVDADAKLDNIQPSRDKS